MKIGVDEDGNIELTEVYNPVILTTNDGFSIAICARDFGFDVRKKTGGVLHVLSIDGEDPGDDRLTFTAEQLAKRQ